MKNFIPKRILPLFFITAIIFWSCSPLSDEGSESSPLPPPPKGVIQTSIDLVDIVEDKALVTIDPDTFTYDEVVFRIPKIVPGTYTYSNFGRFIDNFKAYDHNGDLLSYERTDDNTWMIAKGKSLDKISYYVNDTFDSPIGTEIYPMGGTNIESGETYLLNLYGFVGYFDKQKEVPYRLAIKSPENLKGYTSLKPVSSSNSLDVFEATRYFEVTDNPILYTDQPSVSFTLDNIQVRIAMYSVSGDHKAEDFEEAFRRMMIAQKKFLGAADATKQYNILLHLGEYSSGGALEHHTSTVAVFPDSASEAVLNQHLVNVISHEFFHILTPLGIHSEEIHNFNYNEAVMSKHLWMYEGTTEYFANLFQVNQGLIDETNFLRRMTIKIADSFKFDNTLSFTEMSKGVVDEPYKSNYPNVYLKGASINMCLDIIIREKSKGQRGILWVMKELAKRYGPRKPFEDDALIDEIVEMTYPEVKTFFEKHVEGNTPIDYPIYLQKVGVEFTDVGELVFIESPTPEQLKLRRAWLKN